MRQRVEASVPPSVDRHGVRILDVACGPGNFACLLAEAAWLASQGVTELVLFVTTFVTLGILNWRYICFLLCFWYFGHSLSYLNGYYRHYGGNPDKPIAWGVSSYNKLYNWTWFYNGYHAEHHFRPKVHWTRMEAFRDQILEQQRVAGVRVIRAPHALGFLDPDLRSARRLGSHTTQSITRGTEVQ